MKDTHQSTQPAIMSSSSEAMEACISPTSTPAENPWLKKRAIHPLQAQPLRKSPTQSDWFHQTRDPGVIRTGDSPCDAQGATEPEGVATPGVNTARNALSPSHQKPFHHMKPESGAFPQTKHTSLDQCSNVSQEESRSKGHSPNTKHMPRKFGRHSIAETERFGTEKYFYGSAAIPSHPLQRPKSVECNTDTHAKNTLLNDHLLPCPSPTGTSYPPWKAGWNVASAVQNQRKPSNLSEIERQRGPLKKRHINYQPEVLDLSTKRTKVEAEVGQESPVASSNDTSSSCSHAPSSQADMATLSQEQLSMTLKQEPVDRVVNNEIPLLSVSQRGLPVFEMGDRKHNLAGVTYLDQKRALTQPPASFGSQQFFNQTLGISNICNTYQAGSPVPVLHSTELVRQWVLHVTQSNEMFASQNLQATAKANRDSESSHSTFDISYRGSMSSPTLKNPSRGPALVISTASNMEKPYACEHCSSTFKHRHHVIRHMRAHNGERPFHCEHCGATFARKCVLTNHRRTHTGEKPYICTECGDTFSRKHHLVIHQRTHSGEKPYHCMDCGAAFARSHHVNRHRKTHEREQEVDARIQHLESTSNNANDRLPTAAPFSLPDTPLDPETESKSNLESVVPQSVENINVEMIRNLPVENTQSMEDKSETVKEEIDVSSAT